MSDTVTSLRGKLSVPAGEPVPEIIELLEHFLDQAKRGDLVGVAVAGVNPDSTPKGIPFTQTGFEYARGNGYALESAINRLHRRFGRWMDPDQ